MESSIGKGGETLEELGMISLNSLYGTERWAGGRGEGHEDEEVPCSVDMTFLPNFSHFS